MSPTRARNLWFLGPAAAQAAGAALGLLTNIVYARDLGTQGYGVLAISISIGMVLSVVADGGVTTYLNSQSRSGEFAYKSPLALYRKPFATFLIGATVISTPLLLGGTLIPSAHTPGLIALGAFVVGISYAVFQASQTALQVTARYAMRNVLLIANAATTLLFAVIISGVTTNSILQVLGSAFGYVVVSIPGLSIMYRARSSRAREVENEVLYRSRSLMFSNLFNYSSIYGDVVVVGALSNASVAGVYQIAKKFAQTATMPFASLVPVLMSRIAREPSASGTTTLKWVDASTWIFSAGNLLSFFVAIPLIEVVFGIEFAPSLPLVLAVLVIFELQFHKDLLAVLNSVKSRFSYVAKSNLVPLLALAAGSLLLLFKLPLLYFCAVLALGQVAAIILLALGSTIPVRRVVFSSTLLSTALVASLLVAS